MTKLTAQIERAIFAPSTRISLNMLPPNIDRGNITASLPEAPTAIRSVLSRMLSMPKTMTYAHMAPEHLEEAVWLNPLNLLLKNPG
jgi:hypothetical protein